MQKLIFLCLVHKGNICLTQATPNNRTKRSPANRTQEGVKSTHRSGRGCRARCGSGCRRLPWLVLSLYVAMHVIKRRITLMATCHTHKAQAAAAPNTRSDTISLLSLDVAITDYLERDIKLIDSPTVSVCSRHTWTHARGTHIATSLSVRSTSHDATSMAAEVHSTDGDGDDAAPPTPHTQLVGNEYSLHIHSHQLTGVGAAVGLGVGTWVGACRRHTDTHMCQNPQLGPLETCSQ
jgi:hypothetical protein